MIDIYKEFKNYITERATECSDCPLNNPENDKCYLKCDKIDIIDSLIDFSNNFISTVFQILINSEKNKIEKLFKISNKFSENKEEKNEMQ